MGCGWRLPSGGFGAAFGLIYVALRREIWVILFFKNLIGGITLVQTRGSVELTSLS